MNVLNKGVVRWMIARQNDGTVVWTIVGTRGLEDERVLQRGTSKSATEARRELTSALVAYVNGLRLV